MSRLADNKFGTGYIPDEVSGTDYVFGGRTDSFDWMSGFDVEDKLRLKLGSNFSIPPKDQKQTLSCGGQSASYYASVLYPMLDISAVQFIEFSARDIYSHNFLPGGGASAWDICLWLKNNGVLREEELPSKPMEESQMRNRGLEEQGYTESYKLHRQLIKGGRIEIVSHDIDVVARAIRDNYGVLIGLMGENNGTWHTEFPKIPTDPNISDWGHLVYAGKCRNLNGKKQIGILNSWGNIGNKGWQWLGEEWFGSSDYIKAIFTWTPKIEDIQSLDKYKLIDKHITENNLEWWHTDVWALIKKQFATDLSRNNFYDYLQFKKYLIN